MYSEDVRVWFPMETFRIVSTFAIFSAVIKRTGRYLSAEWRCLTVGGRAQIKEVHDSSRSRYW